MLRKKLQSQLVEKDFLLCILNVRTICEEMSSSTDGFGVGDNSVLLLKLDSRFLFVKFNHDINLVNKVLKCPVIILLQVQNEFFVYLLLILYFIIVVIIMSITKVFL